MKEIYLQHPKLVKLLSLLTGLFLLVVVFMWWQELQSEKQVPITTPSLLKFSSKYSLVDPTREYAFGARIIHDAESYDSIKKLFFTDPVPIPTNETIKRELIEVENFKYSMTAEDKDRVFNTSYYVGNFLALPNRTLQQVLFEKTRPETSKLMETALADIRAGVIKIQDLYDVASPVLYADSASTSPLYFTTPSFPSLTVAEVSLLALMLSVLDEPNARLYERQAQIYASEVYATGAHFKSDIKYAMVLAELYLDIMLANDSYQSLFSAAKTEWSEVVKSSEALTKEPASQFTFQAFPYRSQVSISDVVNYDYQVSYSNEELGGRLLLSLIDNRLPKPGLRLYELLIKNSEPLPFTLDASAPGNDIGEAIGLASYEDFNNFTFMTGERGLSGEIFLPGTIELFRKSGQTLSLVATADIGLSGNGRTLYSSEKQKIFFTAFKADESHIYQVALSAKDNKPVLFATGTTPFFLPNDILLYVENSEVKAKSITNNQMVRVFGIEPSLPAMKRDLYYFSQQKIVALVDRGLDQVTAIPYSKVRLYALKQGTEEIEAEIRYCFTLEDGVVQAIELSPAGQYVALGITETAGQRSPKLLILDTFNGIIKKEVDLSDFNQQNVFIDGWLPL